MREDTTQYILITENFNYNTLIVNKDYGLLFYKNNTPKVWREVNMLDIMPNLIAYLLHDLFDHSKASIRKLIFNIDTIWVNIIQIDQREIKKF